jgi:hypothetical protein
MIRLVGVSALTVLTGFTASTQQPVLEDVLAKASAYHSTYLQKVSGVVLDEQIQMLDVSGGKTRGVIRVSADVVLVGLQGQVISLRDPYAVDTQPLRPKGSRISALLGAPATPTIKDWELAASYPAQGSVHFILDLQLKVNEPTSALQFISAALQPKLKYRLDGQKKMNDVPVVGVRFEEPTSQDMTHVLGTRSNARATGRFWIDPVTGAIHQTELWVDSKWENAIVSVKFAPHKDLGLLLPTDMNDTYEEREGGGGPRQMGSGADPRGSVANRVSVQSRSNYSKATLAPIDLTKLRR